MGVLQRRQFLGSTGALLLIPLASAAQQLAAMPRIGVLSLDASTAPIGQQQQQLFRESLRRFGYEGGKNLGVEWRFAEGNVDRLNGLVEELIRLKVGLIVVASSNEAILAAKRQTRTIPIVMHIAGLPVETGFIESYARPGGNVTGTAWIGPETLDKVFQVLKEALPATIRVAILADPRAPGVQIYRQWNDRAASALGISLQYVDVTQPSEISGALERIAASRPDALWVTPDPVIRSRAPEIVAFTLERKLPTLTSSFSFANAGCLLYYGVDIPDTWDLTTRYVDQILKGAKPADLPVELPRKFLLIVNAKTARAIGYTIPQQLRLRADRVIE